jgi:lysophospholipase L1-like esterase
VSPDRLLFPRFSRSPAEAEVSPPFTYAALGASDAVGVGADDPLRDAWVSLIFRRLPPGTRFLRLGVGGALTRHALKRQVPRAEAARPQLVTVWLGVNDFTAKVSLGTYGRHLRRILARLGRTGARAFVGNLPDLTKVPAFAELPPDALLATLGSWNHAIAEIAHATGAQLVDLMGASGSDDSGSLVAADGYHPSTLGHRVLSELFWARIAADPALRSLLDP